MLAAATFGCLLAVAAAVPQLGAAPIMLTTFDGASATTQTWRSENDPVMGGVSTGSFKVDTQRKLGVWQGQVKIVPSLKAPGFCTVRTDHTFPDLSEAKGLLVTGVASGDLTAVKISMESSVRLSPRQGEFEARFNMSSTMATHFIPFSSMSQSFRGQKEGGPPTARQLAKITGLGFNEDGVAGTFDFAILSIATGSAPAPGPAPGPGPSPSKMLLLSKFAGGRSEGAKWQALNDPVMGGQSTGSFKITGDEGLWTGDVKVVPSLKAPGFCRLQGEISKTDVSSFDGLLYEHAAASAQSPTGPLSTLVAVIETKGFLASGQWTAPIKVLPAAGKGNSSSTDPLKAFVAFADFRPFGIRPEKGKAPTRAQLRDLVQVGLLADGTAGKFTLELLSVSAVGRPGPAPPAPGPDDGGLELFKFGAAGVAPWRVTNDPVMGGRSKSTFKVGTDGAGNANVGLFSGDVAIVPALKAPGFCNAFVAVPNKDASEYDAIEIVLRSHGPLTAFKSSWGGKGVPKDPNCHHPGCQYKVGSFKAGFNVTQQGAGAKPQTVVIPFTDYTYEWSDFTGGCTDHGAVCCSREHPEVCPSKTALAQITQIGIWGEGTAGAFALDVFSVKAVKMQMDVNTTEA